ncbi:MAG: glycosyltransferase [Myxococcales bacterium]
MTIPSSLRILDLCEFFSDRGGGVRSYLERMAKAAQSAKHELIVVAPGGAHEETFQAGMKLIRYPAPRMPYDGTYRMPWRLDLMRAAVAREKPDVVQISSPFAPALAARFLPRGPVRAYFYHSDPIGCYVRPVLQRALPMQLAQRTEHTVWGVQRAISRTCDVTIVAGNWLAEVLEKQGCERVRTVPFGISREDLGPRFADPELRRRLLGPLANTANAALLLIAGRLAADKRQALLLDALIELQRTQPVALVVLGDGPERAALQRKAGALRHASFVPFTHNRQEFAAIVASVDALLHGSTCETFGFVVAEALASGTPVIVPDAGGAGALAKPEYAEAYAPQADAAGVARAVQRLLARPREEMRRAALHAADTFPSSERHFEDLFRLYRELLGMRPS